MFCREYKSISIGMFRIKVGDSSFSAENGQCLTGLRSSLVFKQGNDASNTQPPPDSRVQRTQPLLQKSSLKFLFARRLIQD